MSSQVDSGVPKYLQIANALREQIVDGTLAPGDELPSERMLVDSWGVSRPTATRSLAFLRAEGLAEARQGSGTFVRAQPQLRRARDRYARSRQAGRVYTRGEWADITHAELVPSPDHVSEALRLPVSSPVIRRRRIIHEPDGVAEVAISWLDGSLAQRAPKLLDRERIREGTLAYVERRTRRRAQTAVDRIGARLATKDERDALGLIGSKAAVLVVRHTAWDAQGRPIEYVEASYPPDRWTFEQRYPIPG